MAITYNRNLKLSPQAGAGELNGPATNTSVFYAGTFCMKSSTTGYVVIPADTSGFLWAGIVTRKVTGDTGASPVPKVEYLEGPVILHNYPVTGATAVTDNNDPVYCTDNSTLDKSSTSNTKPVGEILRWLSSTSCDVLLYSGAVSRAQ
jgi:hypothetical protein